MLHLSFTLENIILLTIHESRTSATSKMEELIVTMVNEWIALTIVEKSAILVFVGVLYQPLVTRAIRSCDALYILVIKFYRILFIIL